MPFCSFGESYALFDVTPVENLFVQEYMLRAPGNYVKAYLYGLLQCYHPAEGMSLTRMARDMGMEEDEVFQAFQYWERMGLVRRVADQPPSYAYKNLKHNLLMSSGEAETLYQYKDFNRSLHNLFDKKRKLYEQDYQRVYDWIEVLGLPEAVALMLIRHCVDLYGLRFSFEKADALAREWAEHGVRTIEEAEEQTRRSKQLTGDVRKVLRRLGQRREPSMDEEELCRKWMLDWGFSLAAILEACRETTKGTPSMAYLNGILERQHRLGRHDAPGIAGQLAQEAAQAEPMRAVYQALGRRGVAPTAEDIAWARARLEGGASAELLVLAAQTAHRGGGNSLETVQRLLDAWRAHGMTDVAAVETYLAAARRDEAQAAELLEASGDPRRPTAADRALVAKWRDAWGMPREVLLLAAGYAAGAEKKAPFMDKILAQWQSQGIRTAEAAQAERARHVAAQGTAPGGQAAPGTAPPKRPVREVAQHRYTQQRQYTEEELNALLFDAYPDDTTGGKKP